jgi:RNA polymerase sigma factor (TIGR02999 family)
MNGAAEPRLQDSARSITTLLNQINGGGDDGAFGRLAVAVYDDLRRVAARRMRRDFDGPLAAPTETPTGLVDHAILKLREQRMQWKDGDHFFAIATRLLGYVIGDYRKQRMAVKRGRGRRNPRRDERLDTQLVAAARPEQQVDEKLKAVVVVQALHERHPRKAEVVTLRVLADRSVSDIARMIGISLPTAERDWKFAKAWIRDYLDAHGACT